MKKHVDVLRVVLLIAFAIACFAIAAFAGEIVGDPGFNEAL